MDCKGAPGRLLHKICYMYRIWVSKPLTRHFSTSPASKIPPAYPSWWWGQRANEKFLTNKKTINNVVIFQLLTDLFRNKRRDKFLTFPPSFNNYSTVHGQAGGGTFNLFSCKKLFFQQNNVEKVFTRPQPSCYVGRSSSCGGGTSKLFWPFFSFSGEK